MPKDRSHEWYVFSALALVASALIIFLFAPSFSALVLALTLTVIFRPFFLWLMKVTKNRKSLSAFITVAVCVLLIFVPVVIFGYQIFQELQGMYDGLLKATGPQARTYDPLLKIIKFLPDILRRQIGSSFSTSELVGQLANWLVQHVGEVIANLNNLLLIVFVSLIGMYYFLKDGAKFRDEIAHLVPLSAEYTHRIFSSVLVATSAVVRGTLLVAGIQGLSAGIGFYIFSVPSPVLWGTIAVFAALFPAIGTGIVIIPAVAYLISQGLYVQAVGLTAWGILIVGTVDNLLRPILMRRGSDMHPFFILLSIIGGLSVFGPIGFLAGPLVLSFFLALISIYSEATTRDIAES